MYKQHILPYVKNSVIEYKDYFHIGQRVFFGDNVLIRGDSVFIDEDTKFGCNVKIYSKKVLIGARTKFSHDTEIIAYEKLKIGNDCIIRSRAYFKARSIEIGHNFYSNDNPRSLVFGGGGSDSPTAHLKIGDRCVMHDSYINVCRPVTIGNDVGLSPSSAIITHGFWNSVIEGYPNKFAGVTIGNNCIVGYGAMILMGVELGDYVSVGAGAVVTKSFPKNTVIGGIPAKIIKQQPNYPKELTYVDKLNVMINILKEYALLLKDKVDKVAIHEGSRHFEIYIEYNKEKFIIVFSPSVHCPIPFKKEIILSFEDHKIYKGDFLINLSNYTWKGEENEITDDLRDFLRKQGIRIFSRRWFKSIQPKVKRELGL